MKGNSLRFKGLSYESKNVFCVFLGAGLMRNYLNLLCTIPENLLTSILLISFLVFLHKIMPFQEEFNIISINKSILINVKKFNKF